MVKRRRLELPRNNFHYPLKVARLPIPPPGQLEVPDFIPSFIQEMSGKRGSNPRPRPWQGRALPTELLPHYPLLRSTSLNAVAKVMFFSDFPNFYCIFFLKSKLEPLVHSTFIIFIAKLSQNLKPPIIMSYNY